MKFSFCRLWAGLPVLMLVLASLILAACGDSTATNSPAASNSTASSGTSNSGGNASSAPPPVSGNTVKNPSGLQYIDTKVGDGTVAKAGNLVQVQYTGYLTNGTKFDSSLDRNQPFPFTLGSGQVIKGWDEGVAGMKVGGKRRLIIPPDLGYGARGAGAVIPPNATLVFDVELLSVK